MFVPVTLNGHRFGWVSQQRADGLLTQRIAAVQASGHGIGLHVPDVDDGLHEIHLNLAAQGMLQDWRNEWIEVLDWSGVLRMGRMERAAARFWGSHTRAVHLNAWVQPHAQAQALLWVAKRAASKSTDPGLWDNLVAGGLGVDESPLAGLRREALEEAGLDLAWAKQVHIGPTLKICLFNISQRAYNYMLPVIADKFRWHSFEFAAKKHIKKQVLQHIVAMMS